MIGLFSCDSTIGIIDVFGAITVTKERLPAPERRIGKQ